MIDKFLTGGDFHSETAIEMYAELTAAVEKGELAVEDVKLLHPEKRRAAKAINFGIAYGRSSGSVARDLRISLAEATTIQKRWCRMCVLCRSEHMLLFERRKTRTSFGFYPHIIARSRQISRICL